jgi:ParB family chromosome partitioning protein
MDAADFNDQGKYNMDLLIPLNRLIFGQDDGHGINARITGRDEGIAELAANLHARGQIENLVVKRVDTGTGEYYSVSAAKKSGAKKRKA